MAFHTNILDQTRSNVAFRRVVYTGRRSQLVTMNIAPGDDVGLESHDHVEQLFFVVAGTGQATVDRGVIELLPGDVLVVPPGTRHDIINTGDEPLQLYTVYAPPNHLDMRVHLTHDGARADLEDEAFGHHVH